MPKVNMYEEIPFDIGEFSERLLKRVLIYPNARTHARTHAWKHAQACTNMRNIDDILNSRFPVCACICECVYVCARASVCVYREGLSQCETVVESDTKNAHDCV